MSSKLLNIYHSKQLEVLKFAMNRDFFMLINHGAKRTGKTIINNDIFFLVELKRVRAIADREGVPEPQYILAGATLGSLYRNVLQELTSKYGLEFHMDKFNRFMLLGVQVCCFGHSKINDLGRIRGMTAYGAYINEGSVANEEVLSEIKSRCSGDGARILIDTNPDHPEHWLKTEYIDKADQEVIAEFHWELDDNTFLTDRYKNNIKASTPSGMFYERDILGKWVTGEGSIYKDFDQSRHYISSDDAKTYKFSTYYAGVDWGYEHPGAIVLLGETDTGDIVLLKEYSAQHKEIDYWVEVGKDIKREYGNIMFYADSARPEHVIRFNREGLKCVNAEKARLSGVEEVSKVIKSDKFRVVKDQVDLFKKEIYMYSWNKKTGEPMKEHDDVLDALRYAIYTRCKFREARTTNYSGKGAR